MTSSTSSNTARQRQSFPQYPVPRELDQIPDFSHLAQITLAEDISGGDPTTWAIVPDQARLTADIVAREPGVISGLDAANQLISLAPQFFPEYVHPQLGFETAVSAGDRVQPGDIVATLSGHARSALIVERSVLNIISHASAVATHTAQWVEAVAGTGAVIRDSRKTLPGLRLLQKRAVRDGGGVPHRYSLSDQVMVKDNHVSGVGVVEAYRAVTQHYPQLWCEIEVDTLEQLSALLDLRPVQILLDNFSVADTRAAVALRNDRSPSTLLESSGGLSLDQAREYAETGVNSLAVGALTHSVTVLDLGLDRRLGLS